MVSVTVVMMVVMMMVVVGVSNDVSNVDGGSDDVGDGGSDDVGDGVGDDGGGVRSTFSSSMCMRSLYMTRGSLVHRWAMWRARTRSTPDTHRGTDLETGRIQR